MSQLPMEFSFQAVILHDIFYYYYMREMDTGKPINPLHRVNMQYMGPWSQYILCFDVITKVVL